MANYKVWMENLDKKLHEKNRYTDYLEKAEKASGIPRLYIVGVIAGLWALYMILGHGAELICNSIGFAYPAYASMIAIETHIKEDDTKWLTYWVVFAALSIAEFFSDFIVGYIPFYWLLKCLFLIWCAAPIANNGSQFLYLRIIRPVFLKNREAIDNTLNKALSGAAGMAAEATKLAAGGKSE